MIAQTIPLDEPGSGKFRDRSTHVEVMGLEGIKNGHFLPKMDFYSKGFYVDIFCTWGVREL